MKIPRSWIAYFGLQLTVLILMITSLALPKWFSQNLDSEYNWQGGITALDTGETYAEMTEIYCSEEDSKETQALCELFTDISTTTNIILTLSLFVSGSLFLTLASITCYLFNNNCLAYTYLSSFLELVSAIVAISCCFGIPNLTLTSDCTQLVDGDTYGPVCVHPAAYVLVASVVTVIVGFGLHCVIAVKMLGQETPQKVYQEKQEESPHNIHVSEHLATEST